MAMTFDIDDEFYMAMQTIGGRRPADIDPKAGEVANADVVLVDDNAILELKALTEDGADSKAIQRKVDKLYRSWVTAGRMPAASGPVTLSTANLPSDLAIELIRVATQSLETALTKANKQIKTTKRVLNMPTATGILVLANVGNPFLPPEVLFNRLHHLLRSGGLHKSIDNLIFMTHDLPVDIPGLPEPVNIYATPVREGGSPLDPILSEKIKRAWFTQVGRTRPVRTFEGADASLLYDVKHTPR